jgi:hypothetical protein
MLRRVERAAQARAAAKALASRERAAAAAAAAVAAEHARRADEELRAEEERAAAAKREEDERANKARRAEEATRKEHERQLADAAERQRKQRQDLTEKVKKLDVTIAAEERSLKVQQRNCEDFQRFESIAEEHLADLDAAEQRETLLSDYITAYAACRGVDCREKREKRIKVCKDEVAILRDIYGRLHDVTTKATQGLLRTRWFSVCAKCKELRSTHRKQLKDLEDSMKKEAEENQALAAKAKAQGPCECGFCKLGLYEDCINALIFDAEENYRSFLYSENTWDLMCGECQKRAVLTSNEWEKEVFEIALREVRSSVASIDAHEGMWPLFVSLVTRQTCVAGGTAGARLLSNLDSAAPRTSENADGSELWRFCDESDFATVYELHDLRARATEACATIEWEISKLRHKRSNAVSELANL